RSAQSFGKAEHDRVAFRGDLRHRFAKGDCGVKDPRAIEMNRDTRLMRALANVVNNFAGHHCPAPPRKCRQNLGGTTPPRPPCCAYSPERRAQFARDSKSWGQSLYL